MMQALVILILIMKLKVLNNFNVRKIACGQDNTMVLTKENKLYVFGSNNYYQLGVLKSKNIYSPMSFQNIIKTQQENPAVNFKADITSMKFSGKNVLWQELQEMMDFIEHL